MFQNASGLWPSRIVTLLVWLLAGASAMYWGLKLSGPGGTGLNAPVAAAGPASSDPGMVAYLLGVRQSAVAAGPAAEVPAAPNRFVLTGVIAGRAHSQGAALISVDGKAPKPYRVGGQIEAGLVLQSVAPRRAVLAPSTDGPPSFTLDLPTLKK
jgi:general secretion pathway protein C